MSNERFERALDDLLEVLRNTEEYVNYRNTFSAIRDDEGAMECVDRIRELNVAVQEMSEDEYERESDNISAKMEELCSDSKVSDFILAEVDFSRLYQYITARIVSTLDEETSSY